MLDLPEYREEVRPIAMDRGEGEGPSQASCYRQLADALHAAVMQALAQGSRRLLAAYLQALFAYPDACTKGETVIDSEREEVIASVSPLPEDRLYPKERALLELVQQERRLGRRMLVYITHTQSRDISPRLERVLGEASLRVATLKAGTVATDRREEWLARAVKDGVDVLLVHPRLVQTGLDLVDFPTICWYEFEYSVYTMRQASRRSWRIGQRLPVRVVYFAYRGTLQAQALALVAKKLQASLAVEGELAEEGLAAHRAGGDDLLLEMARSLTERSEASEESLEGLFAEVRQAAGEAEMALQPDDLAPEEPEPAASPPSETAATPVDPSVAELPLFGGAAKVLVTGNGREPVIRPTEDASNDAGSVEETPPREPEQLLLF